MANTPKILDLSRFIPANFAVLGRQLSISAGARFNRQFGVNIADWGILSALANEPKLSARQICDRTAFDKALISRRLKLLNQAGYVSTKSSAKISPRTQSSLTQKGSKLYFKIVEIALEREKIFLSGLTKTEITTLKKLLPKLRKNILGLLDQR